MLDDPIEAVARIGARLIMQQALKDEVTDFLGRERYALIIADGAPGRWKATRELWPRAGRVVDLPALISSVNDAWRRSRHVQAGPGLDEARDDSAGAVAAREPAAAEPAGPGRR